MAAVAAAGLQGEATSAPPNVPVPWDRAIDDLVSSDTFLVKASFNSTSVGLLGAPGPIFRVGSMYIRGDEEGRLVADIEGRGRLSFDGTELWLDRPDAKPPVRLTLFEPMARDVIPYIRAGLPGATWRVVQVPEPGVPRVHDERWAEVVLPFSWASGTRTYVQVNADGLLMTVRVVDAATGKTFDGGALASEVSFGARYWNVPLEPDMEQRTFRSLRSYGYPIQYRQRFTSVSDPLFLYHERLQRLPLTFDLDLSQGGAYPGPGEGPGWPMGPVVCTGSTPWSDQPYRLVWMADPQDPRVQLAQAASEDGCSLHLEMQPYADLVLWAGARGRVLGQTTVLDAASMAVLHATPLALTAEGPAMLESATQVVDVDLPPGST